MSVTYFSEGIGLAIMLAVLTVATVASAVIVSRSKMRIRTGTVALGSFFVSLGIFVLVLSESLQQSAFSGNEAAMIPKLWASILIPASLFMIFRAVKGIDEDPENFGRLDKVAAVIAALVISTALIEYFGYFLCTSAFVFICMFILGYKKYFTMTVISASWAAFAYFVFYKLLYVSLPLGSIIKAIFNI